MRGDVHFDGGTDIRFVGGARDGLRGCDRQPPEWVRDGEDVYVHVSTDADGTLVYKPKA